MRWIFWRPDPLQVSQKWLSERGHRDSRIEYHGVQIKLPVKKILNDSPIWNRYQQEKKRA